VKSMNSHRNRAAAEKDAKKVKILNEGKKLYVNELGKQIILLEKLLNGFEDTRQYELAKQIYRLIHTLKGSAPIFGFTKLGQIAEDFIDLWEWVHGHELEMTSSNEPAYEVKRRITDSTRYMNDLRMEHRICKLEIELEGAGLNDPQSIMANHHSRLLLIDDDVLRSYLARRLQLDGYQTEEASTVQLAKQKLRENRYDLVTLDLMMYPESGYEIFNFLKTDPSLKWIPLIVISGRVDLKDKVRCFQMGADDYVTKPFHYEELNARIYSLLARTHNFEQMAFRDPLTGVNNRRYFDYQVQTELLRIERYPAPISLVFIDIDKFKLINDTYGHSIGDLVLQGLSHIIQQNLRTTDLLARFGGEEFVIILPNTQAQNAILLINGILDYVRNHHVVKHEGKGYSITFSAGIAEYEAGKTVEEWIHSADEAMYQAKLQGRNRVTVFGQMPADPISGKERRPEIEMKSILIADDDHILRSILKTQLNHLPVMLIEAEDGEDAALNLQLQHFDLCILDGVMPKLDGFSLLKRIKSEDLSLNPNVKVLMLTGRKKEEDVINGLMMGADDYMSKPFSIIELEIRVSRLLGL
jgi:two-component system cell cycle response regulator